MHRGIFGQASVILPRTLVDTSPVCFLVGPHVRHRHPAPPEHLFCIASTSPDILPSWDRSTSKIYRRFLCSPQGSMPSPGHLHYTPDASPIYVLSYADGSPTVADSKSTSPNIRRSISDISRSLVTFNIGTHRHQNTHLASPVHRQTFFPRETVAYNCKQI